MSRMNLSWHVSVSDRLHQADNNFCWHSDGTVSIWIRVTQRGRFGDSNDMSLHASPERLQSMIDVLQLSLSSALAKGPLTAVPDATT